MSQDRHGETLSLNDFVGVYPHNSSDPEALGAEFFGVVADIDGDYVMVVADDPGRGTVEVRSDLVFKSGGTTREQFGGQEYGLRMLRQGGPR